MNRREFVLGAAAFAQTKGQPAAARPNILVIMADDLAAWMCGCYGNKEIRTPNIDGLARSGIRFANGFVATPICSASRATFFTGRLPRQHGIHDFLTENPVENPPQGQKAPPPSFDKEIMISDVLAGAGYNCGYAGKWHMGREEKPGHGYSWTYTMTSGPRTYTDPAMYLNGERIQEQGYLTELITKRAGEFLDKQQSGAPFFLTVSYLNPHTPYQGHPQKYYDMYANTTFQTFGTEPAAANALREKDMLKDTLGNIRRAAAATTALDDQIPLLMRKLQERKLYDNTLVFFVGDNGYLLGRHGLWSKGLASDPINMYEEVIRVPFILSWPGKIPTEAMAPELVSFYDVMPSLCWAAGVPAPAGRNLTGRNFMPIAKHDPPIKGERWRNLVFGHFRNTEMARDNRFKLVLRNEGSGPNELYDLSKDPRERTNLYDNAQFITVRDRLSKEIQQWRRQTSA
jgi:arylsulfatase A-like enzyme